MRQLLIWGGGIAGTLIALVAIVILTGALLPVAHHVTKSAIFSVPQQRLWDMAIDRFHRTNDGNYAILEEQPPRRLVTGIVKKGLPFGGRWTFLFEPVQGGTRLTISEDGEIYNPFFRFVSRFILGYEGSIDAFFAALRDHKETASG